MNDGGMWDSLGPRFVAMGLHPVRVENTAAVGTPDVNYTHGWCELKFLREWPKRENTLVRVHTLIERPQQVVFLMRRWELGVPSWLLLRVGRQLLLFSGWDSRAVRLGRTRDELLVMCAWNTDAHGRVTSQLLSELHQMLTWDMEAMAPPRRAMLCRLRAKKTLPELAAALGWAVPRAALAEIIDGQDTSDLLDHWNA